MWIYAQRTGNLFRQTNGSTKLLTKGYSGSGVGENNPEMQFVHDQGPIPQGRYRIGHPEQFNHMQNCLPLSPDAGTKMHGRGGFFIHDGVFHGPHGDTSHGSICVLPAARSVIWDSGDHELEVVQDDPIQARVRT